MPGLPTLRARKRRPITLLRREGTLVRWGFRPGPARAVLPHFLGAMHLHPIDLADDRGLTEIHGARCVLHCLGALACLWRFA